MFHDPSAVSERKFDVKRPDSRIPQQILRAFQRRPFMALHVQYPQVNDLDAKLVAEAS